jgi:hypothetical protein
VRRRKGGAIRGPPGRPGRGASLARPWLPLPEPVAPFQWFNARRRFRSGSNSPFREPPMKRLHRWGCRTRSGMTRGAKLWPSPGDAPFWEDSTRRPDSASALRVGCGTHRGRDGPTTRPHRSGRVADAADGPQPPLVASLLPLAVRATREGPRPGLANGNAPRRAACPNLGRRVALNEVGVMLRGRGSERRPSWVSQWKVRTCGSPRMAGRSAC